MITVKDNLPDFKRELDKITLDLQRKSVRGATSAAASVFRAAVRKSAAAPKSSNPRRPRTGTLARAVYAIRNRRASTRGAERFVVSVRSGKGAAKKGRDAFYWRWLEGGWFPRGPGKRLRGGNRSKALARSRLAASGAKRVEYPFIAPAFAAVSSAAVTAFERRITREIEKYNRK